MIRVGAVGESHRQAAYDARMAASQPLIPRPRTTVETGDAARPPAA